MRLLLSLLLLTFVALSVGTAQVKKGNTAPFTNLQLLKPSEVLAQMSVYGRDLGVGCEYCHMPADYATDDNVHKVVAHQMIILTREINAKDFGGSQQVTCYTCHHGGERPLTQPPPAQ
jgi:hypothetical protein